MPSPSGQWPGWTRGLQTAAAGLLLLLAAGHTADAAEPADGAALAGAPSAGAPLAAEVFFRHADLGAARLSPSGSRLAVTVNQGQRVALAVFDLAGSAPPRIVAQYGDADVRSFAWVNDAQLVFNIIEFSAGSGDQRWGPGLLSVGLDGVPPRLLVRTGWDVVVNTTRGLREPLQPNHSLLMVPVGAVGMGGEEVVVGKFQYDAAGELQAVMPLRLNVVTGRTRSMAMGMPEGVTRWWFDPQGEPRVGERRREGQVVLYWRAPGTERWQTLAQFPALAPAFTPLGVDGTGQLFVTVPDAVPDRSTVLKRFDFATGKPEAEAVVRTPGFDFRGTLLHDSRQAARGDATALGVRLLTDAETTVWFDPRLTRLQQLADQKLPGRINRISCSACLDDAAVVLVQSWSDQDPGQLWLYLAGSGRWQPVGAMRKDVDPRRMARLDFHRFKARDGMDIPVWVTLPPAPHLAAAAAPAEPAVAASGLAGAPVASEPAMAPGPRPAVLLVHGGPWLRGGAWHWDAEAQFFASRGYVVISPEFRGSTGYGQRLFAAGFRQWGLAMQDDLDDALQWAVGRGWVDPQRVCIVGAGYGGYAALMGLVRRPERYRCAVASRAMTDLGLLFEWRWFADVSDESRLFALPAMIGDPVVDAVMLAAASPLAQAARIRAPVLLAYGQQDLRVPVEHGEKLRKALQAAGRDPEWVVYPDEGHGLLRPANQFDFARRMENFLAKHLQPAP